MVGHRTRALVSVVALSLALSAGASLGPDGEGDRLAADVVFTTPDTEVRAGTALGPRAGDVPATEALSRRSVPDDVEAGSGGFTVVPGTSRQVGTGWMRTFAIEVEDALDVDADGFADEVERILLDPRGWTAGDDVALRRVDTDDADLRVALARPSTVDLECYPLETLGRFSCWNGDRAMLNASRWRVGAATFGDDIAGYRAYLVNHEVGHGLGHGHVGCPAPGAPAPVMMQQTMLVAPCEPNPWPYPQARR